MSDGFSEEEFRDLLGRVRGGDERAALELVRWCEPEIHREARVRLRDRRLRVVVDAADIVQSVLVSFFDRDARGLFEVESSDDLVRLLCQLTRNKVADTARWAFAEKRDLRRTHSSGRDVLAERVADVSQPPDKLVHLELLEQFQERLTPEEWAIGELRLRGADWQEVASHLGGTPDARRMQFQRAVRRVAREIGLEGG